MTTDTQWQPIETAPIEGRILVFNPFFGVYSSQFTVEYEPTEAFLPRTQQKVRWQGYPLGLADVGFGRWYCVPTHWMPLPPPPKETP